MKPRAFWWRTGFFQILSIGLLTQMLNVGGGTDDLSLISLPVPEAQLMRL